jgi:hypothetical protein
MEAVLLRDDPHLHASYKRAGEDTDLYSVWTEGPVLRVEARGVWDVAAAEAYARDITRIVAELRLCRPQLRAIVDRSDVPVFEAGVHERLLATYGSILRADDRVALVVDSSVAKGRIRRIADREDTQSFLSISAAKMWVLAYG